MDNQTENTKICPKNMFVPICITQAICIAVILIAVLVIKFFFKNSYAKLQKWCDNTVFEKTIISDVFNEESPCEN